LLFSILIFSIYEVPTSTCNTAPYPEELFDFHTLLLNLRVPTILSIKKVGLLGLSDPAIYYK